MSNLSRYRHGTAWAWHLHGLDATVAPRYAIRKSAGLAIVTLGPLQLWTVDPMTFHNARIALPKGVTRLKSGLAYAGLPVMPIVPDLDSVVVDNGEHDIAEIMDRVTAWAKTRSKG